MLTSREVSRESTLLSIASASGGPFLDIRRSGRTHSYEYNTGRAAIAFVAAVVTVAEAHSQHHMNELSCVKLSENCLHPSGSITRTITTR